MLLYNKKGGGTGYVGMEGCTRIKGTHNQTQILPENEKSFNISSPDVTNHIKHTHTLTIVEIMYDKGTVIVTHKAWQM